MKNLDPIQYPEQATAQAWRHERMPRPADIEMDRARLRMWLHSGVDHYELRRQYRMSAIAIAGWVFASVVFCGVALLVIHV